MAKFILDIYEKRKVVKTYETNDYDMLYGTLEDMMQMSETISDEAIFTKEIKAFKPFLREMFDGITDEELRNVKVKDMYRIMQQAIIYACSAIGESSNEKNLVRTGKQ